MPEKGRRSLGSTPGLVGSRTSLGSGLVWLESVGNKWTEQGLFIQGPPCPITHWAWQPQFFPGPGDFGGISHNLSPRPLFSAGLTAAQPQDWENCPKRAEKAGRKLMSSLLADYRPCILRCPTHVLEIIPARLYCKYFLHGPRKMQDRLLGSGSWRRHRRHSQTPSVDRAGQARQGQ